MIYRLSISLEDTKVKVTLVAVPLLTPVAQKLYRRKHGVFTRKA
jgi:hypothetical protein